MSDDKKCASEEAHENCARAGALNRSCQATPELHAACGFGGGGGGHGAFPAIGVGGNGSGAATLTVGGGGGGAGAALPQYKTRVSIKLDGLMARETIGEYVRRMGLSGKNLVIHEPGSGGYELPVSADDLDAYVKNLLADTSADLMGTFEVQGEARSVDMKRQAASAVEATHKEVHSIAWGVLRVQSWVQWLAQDWDGTIYAYENKPDRVSVGGVSGLWCNTTGRVGFVGVRRLVDDPANRLFQIP